MSILQDDALLALFCSVDDYCRTPLSPRDQRLLSGKSQRNRARSLSKSEIITLLVAFHLSKFRDFKAFYLGFVCLHWRGAFPKLVSYSRFIEYIPSALLSLFSYLRSLFGKCTGITFADSTALAVCENPRIEQHRVFQGTARRGKTSTGWFFGFKLHLLVNDCGELLNVTLTAANKDDRKPLPDLLAGVFGKLIADKGYLSRHLSESLREQGVEMVTKVRKNMEQPRLTVMNAFLLRKRAIIESVIDQPKNISQVEHTRHRAFTGFLWNLAAALIAYCHQPKKPSLNLPKSGTPQIA
ncbi:MAG: IS982 family transposase [Akkermansiaceae bacterium]|nr:IS982 family transposase [Armatimonadota bacterium]